MLASADPVAFHPGSYLRELLLWQRISAEDFADRTGMALAEVIDLTEERLGVTRPVSEVLAAHFGNSSQFWLDLQTVFDRVG